MGERRKTPSFDEQVARRSNKRPQPYTSKSAGIEKSPYSTWEVKHVELDVRLIDLITNMPIEHRFESIPALKRFLSNGRYKIKSIAIEYAYVKGHSGSNEFTDLKTFKNFLERNANLYDYLKYC